MLRLMTRRKSDEGGDFKIHLKKRRPEERWKVPNDKKINMGERRKENYDTLLEQSNVSDI
jgi:hypothetical protein